MFMRKRYTKVDNCYEKTKHLSMGKNLFKT